jgi:hypothetical protein
MPYLSHHFPPVVVVGVVVGLVAGVVVSVVVGLVVGTVVDVVLVVFVPSQDASTRDSTSRQLKINHIILLFIFSSFSSLITK